jgi:hypothetical protein
MGRLVLLTSIHMYLHFWSNWDTIIINSVEMSPVEYFVESPINKIKSFCTCPKWEGLKLGGWVSGGVWGVFVSGEDVWARGGVIALRDGKLPIKGFYEKFIILIVN